jgi:hypothetical protein
MKHIIAVIATAFAVSVFAAEAPKAPIATPAVTKADIPATAVIKAEADVAKGAAKKPTTKSPAKTDDKKAVAPTAPATAPASK